MPISFDQVRRDTPCPSVGGGPAAWRHLPVTAGECVVTMPGASAGWGGGDRLVMISVCRQELLSLPDTPEGNTGGADQVCVYCRGLRADPGFDVRRIPRAHRRRRRLVTG